MEPGEVDAAGRSKYGQILGIKTVHFLAIFALIYVGVEVTLGGRSTRYFPLFIRSDWIQQDG